MGKVKELKVDSTLWATPSKLVNLNQVKKLNYLLFMICL